jgi:6-pyruvoyltetrahydropterin/6-carboxytetrahydropterin synthase
MKEPYVCDFNPTAENMAEYLLHTVCPGLLTETGVLVTKVVVWETPNCSAEAILGEHLYQ